MNFSVLDTNFIYEISANLPFLRHVHSQTDYIAISLMILKCLMLVLSIKRFRLLLVGLVVTLGYLVLFLKANLTLAVLVEEVLYFWALLCMHFHNFPNIHRMRMLGMRPA